MDWYPIKMTFHIRTYAFGERLIPELIGKQGLPDGVVAETWEISDYGETTATITNGPLAGKTLHEATLENPDELVGQGWRGPHFPLLAKFLDASHMLPVHLHADDETAARVYGAPNGKSEAWHILWAEPDATIIAGLKGDFSDEELRSAFLDEDYDRVMERYPISAGDTVYVPGGIIHSFGPGTLIYEIQQTSDLGQFVMPNDLYGERLTLEQWNANIDATLAELKRDYMPRPNPGLGITFPEGRIRIGAVCPHFALERWALDAPVTHDKRGRRCGLLSNVGERVVLRWSGGEDDLQPGESCILPAALGPVEVIPEEDTGADLIYCYVPDIQADIIEPLRDAGFTDDEIATLGHVFPNQQNWM
jgi:mannose-6-phosphate isomerase